MFKKKLILVIGATGAQSFAVIDELLAPTSDGTPSPYTVRALTRDTKSRRAQLLASKGVELAKGRVGAWVNTDGFTVGEAKEVFAGMRIFELAKQAKTVRHYVWSNIDYTFKKGGYDPAYRVEHCGGEGRPSGVSEGGMSWSMEMLNISTFGPIGQRKDGTFIFATPIAFCARNTFDHRAETSGRDLEIATKRVSWDHLAATRFEGFLRADHPVANERAVGDGSTTWRENFRDDVLERDYAWIHAVNPGGYTLGIWMRETGYTGRLAQAHLLKNGEDDKAVQPNLERIAKLLE
ncbi:NAD(P)-binding protein [Trametes elegans]|nr:NAD(P)-binding protein [Trametes elegans]